MSASPEAPRPPSTSTPRGKRFSYLWSLLIFLCGVLTGAGFGIIGLHFFMEHRFRHPEQMYRQLVDQADRDVRFTPEQRAKVDGIVERTQEDLRKVFRTEIDPRINASFDSLREEVAGVLTEQQAATWRKTFDSMRARSLPPFPPPQKRPRH